MGTRIRPDGTALLTTVLVALPAAVLVLGGLFLGLQVVTGQLNMADVLHRVPKPLAALVVENPDEAMRLDCDDLDETEPAEVARYAAEHGLDLEFAPADEAPARLAAVEWIYWRDRLVAFADGTAEPPALPGGACPG